MTHYERLGVRSTATATEIRDAYRTAARRAHPDRHGEASSARMATLNEAYRVLRDPVRRREYDDDLRGATSAARSPDAPRATVDDAWTEREVQQVYEPARFPWRFMLGLATVGIAIVMIGVVLYEAPPAAPVDNILRPGDCVRLSVTLEAAETTCSGPHDATVRVLVPFDQTCPVDTEPFRDRQGMGTACVVRAVAERGAAPAGHALTTVAA